MQKILIDGIRIDGFRGLKDFKMSLSETTVLTGMNNVGKTSVLRWVLIIIFFEILIPPEPFMRDAPHFFYRKYNKNLL